jgi:amidophosphoribosyltransferase
VSHVYDISYGVVQDGDNLVAIDDSIVRGTTLKKSILRILSRTDPRKIVIASTAPQIRYPDFYGIDMSEIGKFIAFQAAISLLRTTGRGAVIEEVYQACRKELKKRPEEMKNRVKAIYKPFTADEISAQISEIVCPRDIPWKGEIQVVFQTIENLHKAVPNHSGDWYFTGDYPTPGGYALVNKAFINYYDKVGGRTYDLLFS